MDRTDKLQPIVVRAVSICAVSVASLMLLMLILSPAGHTQTAAKEPPLTHLPFEIVAAEITRFKQPINLSVGKRKLEYQEAMVLTLIISKKEYEALPPGIEPFLYIGTEEYRIYSVQQAQDKDMLTLTFHIRDWQEVSDKAPMVITILHGEPIRNPEIFNKLKSPLLNKKIILDKRK